MSLAVEGDSSYRRSSGASIARLARTPTPAVLPTRTTALPNCKTGTTRRSLRSPISDTTTKLDKLELRPTVIATPKSPLPVDALPQNEIDETFRRVIQSLPQSFAAAVSNSGSFKKIIKHFLLPDCPHQRAMNASMSNHLFEDISTQEFEAIAYLVRERGYFQKKPKLTYSPCDSILIVEMPRSIHEMPLTDFRESISSAVRNLLYDRYMLRASVEMNLPFKSPKDRYTATPDLSLLLASLSDPEDPEIPLLVECAFSQDRDRLWTKIKKEIDAHPEVVLIVVIIVTETPDYQSPKEGINAWTQFADEDQCRDANNFLCLRKRDTGIMEPQSITVNIADHVWCNITSTEYYVWVENSDGEKIDINHEHTAHGSLFPSIKMEQVMKAISTGLAKARDLIVSFSQKLDPTANTEELANTDVSFSIDWKVVQLGLVAATGLTAHERYQAWYNFRFRGQKRPHSDDEDFKDDATSGSNVNNPDSPSSHTPPTRTTHSMTRSHKALKLG